jgi:hypothetical protein
MPPYPEVRFFRVGAGSMRLLVKTDWRLWPAGPASAPPAAPPGGGAQRCPPRESFTLGGVTREGRPLLAVAQVESDGFKPEHHASSSDRRRAAYRIPQSLARRGHKGNPRTIAPGARWSLPPRGHEGEPADAYPAIHPPSRGGLSSTIPPVRALHRGSIPRRLQAHPHYKPRLPRAAGQASAGGSGGVGWRARSFPA